MINPHNIGFSVNLHDKDGDVYNEGIFIHIDKSLILKFKDTYDLKVFIQGLENVSTEISENLI